MQRANTKEIGEGPYITIEQSGNTEELGGVGLRLKHGDATHSLSQNGYGWFKPILVVILGSSL